MSDKIQKNLNHGLINQMGNLVDDGFLVLDHDGIITNANDMAVRLFGENLVGNHATQLFDPKIFEDAFTEISASKTPVEFVAAIKANPMHQYRIRMRHLDHGMIGLLMMDMTVQHNLEKVRRDFVANVSHELRSPLTSLIGFIETMETAENLDDNVRTKFLGIMNEEASRMSRLVDDLLSLSRVEVEEHVAPTEVLFIDQVVKSVIASFQSRATKKEMSVVFNNATDGQDEGITIMGETDEIMEVFHNLIDNALKYGHPNSEVKITMTYPDAAHVAFDVINQGDGIEDIHLSRLTERFYRVDKSRSRKIGGTGLGLAIVKHIIVRHRGVIDIKSEMGGETTFRVILPRHHLTS